MLSKEASLTNEKLRKKFKNNFELANHAIKIARENLREDNYLSLSDIIDDMLIEEEPVET